MAKRKSNVRFREVGPAACCGVDRPQQVTRVDSAFGMSAQAVALGCVAIATESRPRARVKCIFTRQTHVKRLAPMLLSALLISGCIPMLIKTQPSVEFQIRDESGQAITSASLHFARRPVCFVCFNRQSFLLEQRSDARGVTALPWRREFQLPLMVPDAGPVYYAWSWCIDAPGYLPNFENHDTLAKVPERITITLHQSPEKRKCAWLNNAAFASVLE